MACRPSPPRGGEMAVTADFANRQRCRSGTPKRPISPQMGEMPSLGKEGRTEGGAVEDRASSFSPCGRRWIGAQRQDG
ncbi:MAG: hypothetical protein E5X51_26635 [Mesorhizobium sp.]|nr:MAG: hypothetical protein E5X51_26635 [Mesorhizobium sp.]